MLWTLKIIKHGNNNENIALLTYVSLDDVVVLLDFRVRGVVLDRLVKSTHDRVLEIRMLHVARDADRQLSDEYHQKEHWKLYGNNIVKIN